MVTVKNDPPKAKVKKERKTKEERKKKKSKKDGVTTVHKQQDNNSLMGLVDLVDTSEPKTVEQVSTFKQLGEDECISMVSII